MKSFEFDDVDAFTTGAVGRPGERVFYMQVRAAGEAVTVKCEKQQVAALAQYLRKLLGDLPAAGDRPLPAALELTPEPTGEHDAAFVVGPMGLVFDAEIDRFVVMIEEAIAADQNADDDAESEAEAPSDAELLADQGRIRLRISRGQATAFCERADSTVTAGRPSCIFCGLPKNPDGHACPRMN